MSSFTHARFPSSLARADNLDFTNWKTNDPQPREKPDDRGSDNIDLWSGNATLTRVTTISVSLQSPVDFTINAGALRRLGLDSSAKPSRMASLWFVWREA
jgi:hypothetical protein